MPRVRRGGAVGGWGGGGGGQDPAGPAGPMRGWRGLLRVDKAGGRGAGDESSVLSADCDAPSFVELAREARSPPLPPPTHTQDTTSATT